MKGYFMIDFMGDLFGQVPLFLSEFSFGCVSEFSHLT